MAYPQRLLQDDETIHLDLRPHWWFFAKHIIGGAILVVLGVVLLSAGFGGTFGNVLNGIWGIAALVWAGWIGLRYAVWVTTYFVVTSERVIYRTGVIAKKGVEIPLARINNINFTQGIWERVIGAGDLDIESAGKDGRSTFEDVRHPDGVQQVIYRVMEENERKRASWAAPTIQHAPTERSVAEQIEDLARLRDQGHITPEEYDAKKAELLGRM